MLMSLFETSLEKSSSQLGLWAPELVVFKPRGWARALGGSSECWG